MPCRVRLMMLAMIAKTMHFWSAIFRSVTIITFFPFAFHPPPFRCFVSGPRWSRERLRGVTLLHCGNAHPKCFCCCRFKYFTHSQSYTATILSALSCAGSTRISSFLCAYVLVKPRFILKLNLCEHSS